MENSDFLGVTQVNGRDIVVRKDSVKDGMVMIYISNESQLNADFLSRNNEFEDIELNSNYETVIEVLADFDKRIGDLNPLKDEDPELYATKLGEIMNDRQSYLQSVKGYFNKYGRVKMKKLRGTLSMGYLIKPESMTVFLPELANFNWEEHVGEDFDLIDDILFVKAWVPEMKGSNNHQGKGRDRNRKLKKFNRMIPGQFSFHYDTQQLEREFDRLHPDKIVTISVKLHGTSDITGKILVKAPKWSGFYTNVFNRLPSFLQFTKDVYDVVCSSRSVIINSTINPNKGEGFDGGKVQQNIYLWAERIGKYIPTGCTIYGEIVGYYEGTADGIQKMGGKVFDYGCKPKENNLMIYRITEKTPNGTIDWNVMDVLDWTKRLIAYMKADGSIYADRIRPIDVLYHGKLRDLYPEIPVDENWSKNVLEAMKADKEHFGMEMDEPFCKSKLPREGIVLRFDDDPVSEAFKLKCLKFLFKESEANDKGETCDAEMEERYG
jgi:hypothetical protein